MLSLNLLLNCDTINKVIAAIRSVRVDGTDYGTDISLDESAAYAVFKVMPTLGVTPDTSTYNTLLATSDRDGETVLLEDMRNRNVPRDVITYNTLIQNEVRRRYATPSLRFIMLL